MDPRFGRTTQVKLLGGVLLVRQVGTPFTAMARKLQGIKRRALDLREPFDKFHKVWMADIRTIFAAQGIPRWPALSPAYAAWKRRHYPNKPIMRRSDRWFRSLTSAGSPDHIWQVTPRTIRFGSRVPYGMLHETGTHRLPARPALALRPETFQELNRLVMAHVMKDDGRGS